MKNCFIILFCLIVFASCSTTKRTSSTVQKPPSAATSGDLQFINSISVKASPQNNSTSADVSGKNISSPKSVYGSNAFAVNIEQLFPVQFKYAVMMNTEVESLSNKKLFEFIDEWYGTRYRYGGSTKQGIDCSGFSSILMSAVFGLSLSRTASEQYQQSERINKSDLHEGDLVFFNTRGSISHVGVYLCNNKFVHASTSGGVIISDLDETYYNKRFMGGGRMKK